MAETTARYTSQIYNVAVVYNIYRILLPLILLITFISSPNTTLLGALDPTLFVQVCDFWCSRHFPGNHRSQTPAERTLAKRHADYRYSTGIPDYL